MKNSPHIVMAALVAFGLSSILMAQDGLSVLPESDASFIRQNLPGVVLERVEAAGALSKVDEWLPLEHRRYTYRVAGQDSGTLEMTVVPTNRAPGAPKDAASPGWMLNQPNGTNKYLTQEGGIVAPTAVSTANGFLIRLDPPEPLVLEGTLKSTQTTKVGIYDLHDPTDKSYSGSVKCTWSDLGTWRVKVPHGIHEARLIKVEYNGSIGPASVNAQRYMFFGKGVGPIAFTDMRDISAFLIINVDTNKAGVLESWETVGSEKKTEKSKAD